MIRTFETHKIRFQKELTGRLWKFRACQGDYKDKEYQVMTPCCFESLPDFANYRGEGEYTTTFEAEGNIRLEFKGVSHTAEVYLDGNLISSHYNAYTIFDVICKDLQKGSHTLTIKVDNRFSEKSALHIPNDYMSYGGVSRPVLIENLQEVYIKQIHVTPHKKADNSWSAGIEVTLCNISGDTQHVNATVEAAGISFAWNNILVEADDNVILHADLDFTDVLEWSEKSPNLYLVTATLSKDGRMFDDLIDRFGFREIKINGKEILMNGIPLRIKGVCRHEDHPQFGCAIPPSAMEYDLQLIRDLGANSVRTSHYPNDEVFLDLCDEMGILVWEENHARGLIEENMRNPYFEEQAEQVIREMIPAHYNHPSIYIWGILNECASETEYGRECYRRQFELIKELDSSRPCSFASCKFKTDLSLSLPDVVSYNIYPLWYHDSPVQEYLKDLYTWVQEETEGAGKPFMVTEIGAGGLYGYRNPQHSKWTEEYQAMALEKQITTVLEFKDCVGIYIWQFCDIRISDEWFSTRPRTMNNKGIVDEYRRRKLCYDVVKRLYHELP